MAHVPFWNIWGMLARSSRYLFIDNKRVYLFGASLKDLGKKCFCAMKIEGADIAALKALT